MKSNLNVNTLPNMCVQYKTDIIAFMFVPSQKLAYT